MLDSKAQAPPTISVSAGEQLKGAPRWRPIYTKCVRTSLHKTTKMTKIYPKSIKMCKKEQFPKNSEIPGQT